MQNTRWWNVAVVATAAVLTVVLFIDGTTGWRLGAALAVLVALVVAWFAAGRLVLRANRTSIPLALVIIALVAVGAGFDSALATLQCVGFPLIWTLIARTRDTIYANIAMAVCVGVGTWIGTGRTTEGLVVAVVIETISLAFSLALGFWITAISERSNERGRLIVELETAQARLAALSRDAGAGEERERLAREIHDTIAQDLTGIVLTAQRGLRELNDGHSAEAAAQLGILEENARNALAETRALVASGSAVGVDRGGLAPALRRLGERFARETGIAVSVHADDTGAVDIDRDGEVVLLRCAQEALANVRKHSTATTAELTLSVDVARATVTVCDNGRGFDAAGATSGFGLEGMRERLAFVHGELAVRSTPGGGTTLVATLPREVVA